MVAFKTLVRNSWQAAKRIQEEIDVVKSLKPILEEGDKLPRVLRLVTVLYERNEVWDSKQESVWILYTPVAREPFSNFICNEENTYLEAFLVTIFKQVLEGLAFLHLHGWGTS